MAKEKKKKRFNFIDIIIILIVVGVIAALLYFYVVSPLTKQFFAQTYEIEYTLQVKGMRREFRNKISEGDTVVETESLEPIGTVVKAVYTASKFTGTDSAGNQVVSDYPGMYDAVITVRATSVMPEGLYEVGSYTINSGKVIPFRVPNYIGEAVCVSVNEVSE